MELQLKTQNAGVHFTAEAKASTGEVDITLETKAREGDDQHLAITLDQSEAAALMHCLRLALNP